jgi:AcrR family transcriptional regulator
MPRLTAARWDARRQQILAGAWQCFSAKGFEASSMDDIVAASGVPIASVYTYFSSKNELIAATASIAIEAFAEIIDDLSVNYPPAKPSDILAVIRAELVRRENDERYALTRIAVQTWSEALHKPSINDALEEGYEKIRLVLRRFSDRWVEFGWCPEDIDPGEIVELLMSLAPGLTLAVCFNREFPDLGPILDRLISAW